jgi:hypothetical protein
MPIYSQAYRDKSFSFIIYDCLLVTERILIDIYLCGLRVASLFFVNSEFTFLFVHPAIFFDKISKSSSILILAANHYSLPSTVVNLASNEKLLVANIDFSVENDPLDLFNLRL